MFKKMLIILAGLIALLVIGFFVWHFLFSIYEVKISNNFPGETLSPNSKYFLSCTAINSFGWELKWRNTFPEIKIIEGEKLVGVKKITDNNFEIITGKKEGPFTLEVTSIFSLNPSRYTLSVKNKEK